MLHNVINEPVSGFATKKVITVNAYDDLDEACYILGSNYLKKALVIENGKMIGIINVSDIIKYAVGLIE